MFKKFRNTKFKNSFQRLVLLASYLPYLFSFVERILYFILLLEFWLKLNFIYFYMYYEILIYWVILAHFSFALPLFKQCFFLFLLLVCCLFKIFKPKLFFQYLLKSLRKQQLRGILLNMCAFNLINFAKLYSNVVVRVIWRREVVRSQKTVKQRCVCQHWNLLRWATSN